jgi:hypothetical protein
MKKEPPFFICPSRGAQAPAIAAKPVVSLLSAKGAEFLQFEYRNCSALSVVSFHE